MATSRDRLNAAAARAQRRFNLGRQLDLDRAKKNTQPLQIAAHGLRSISQRDHRMAVPPSVGRALRGPGYGQFISGI